MCWEFQTACGQFCLQSLCIFAVIYFVWRDSFDPKQFGLGFLLGFVFVGLYFFGFNFDNFDAEFRRATIAERFFKPENRLDNFRQQAETNNDRSLLQRIATYEWNIADSRANAPDNFPYSQENFSNESPTRNFEKAVELQKQGKTNEAINILQISKEKFPFLNCEIHDKSRCRLLHKQSKRTGFAGTRKRSANSKSTNAPALPAFTISARLALS